MFMVKKDSSSSAHTEGNVIDLRIGDRIPESACVEVSLRQQQIAQVVEHRSNFFLDILRTKASRGVAQDRLSILAIFDAIDEWVQGEFDKPRGFVGCEFIKTVVEVADHNDPIFKAAAQHKVELVELFEECLNEQLLDQPDELALNLHLLVDGAITQAQLFNDRGSVKRAKALAENLVPGLS